MEKKTFNLCLEVLRRFNNAGILKSVVVIGSWCIYFYRYYFKSKSYSTFIRTTDIDFLVPLPFKFNKELDLREFLEDLGFRQEFRGSKGYIKLVHPDLTIEFLVPERGRGSNMPYPLPELKVNAVRLRYLDFLLENTMLLSANGMEIRLPHPAAYALHKFIIFKRRRKIDKHDRDIEGALRVFYALIHNNDHNAIRSVFNKMHLKWQKTVLQNLESIEEFEIIDILQSEDRTGSKFK
ncbi:MAG: nucleotidyltransferase domain-containing protein [Candidatus Omnitrophica bacterium]|nr:nucleotidyltransferase domain-containing protein [Candidatus Omnitrophota bacterium]